MQRGFVPMDTAPPKNRKGAFLAAFPRPESPVKTRAWRLAWLLTGRFRTGVRLGNFPVPSFAPWKRDTRTTPGSLGIDAALAERDRAPDEINARARAIGLLLDAGVPFVVGGAYAYATYTGIYRDTKDLDLFPRKRDAGRALEVLELDGWRTERTDEVWLYKAFKGEYFVDFIFSSGNGVAVVDDEWFEHAQDGHHLRPPVPGGARRGDDLVQGLRQRARAL